MDEYEISTLRTPIHLMITRVGDDLDVIIAGGKEHIGCVGVISNNCYVINTMKNHREDEIIIALSKKLSKLTDKSIVIKAGIHFDNITKEEIKSVLECIEKIFEIIRDYL